MINFLCKILGLDKFVLASINLKVISSLKEALICTSVSDRPNYWCRYRVFSQFIVLVLSLILRVVGDRQL